MSRLLPRDVAVLDLGSNSFHLLVTSVNSDGVLERKTEAKEATRLGEGTFGSGKLNGVAWKRGMAAIGRLVRTAREESPHVFTAVATSALRDADNGTDFLTEAKRRHNLSVQVLMGREEARLVYRGAHSAFRSENGGNPGRLAVVDIGGGSVEFAVGDDENSLGGSELFLESLPLGFLRVRESCGIKPVASGESTEPLSAAQVVRVADTVRRQAEVVARRMRALAPTRIVFTSGTAKAVVKVARSLGVSSDTAWPRPALRRDFLEKLAVELPRLESREIQAYGVGEARAETVGVGVVIMATLVRMLGAKEIQVTKRALREGVALHEWHRWRNKEERAVRRSRPTPSTSADLLS